MPDSVLQTPGQVLTQVAQALVRYGRSHPDAAVAKVSFTHTPFIDIEEETWRIVATLECYGDLKQPALSGDGEETFLEGARPSKVFESSWAGEGPDYATSIQSLALGVRRFLLNSLETNTQKLKSVQEACDVLLDLPDPCMDS